MNLSIQDQFVDDGPAIFDCDITLDLDQHCLRIDLKQNGVRPIGCGPGSGTEVIRGFKPRFGTGFDSPSQGIGQGRQFSQTDGLIGNIGHPHLPIHQF